jgi:hypothetical protein
VGTRRKIGDVVLVKNGEDEAFMGRIIIHGRGTEPDECVLDCGDPECHEWPVVEVVDNTVRLRGSEFSTCLSVKMSTLV